MVWIFYLQGCTTKALQLAQEKASPENAKYWKIKSVVSAVKQENGDISVCVELNESGETAEPKLNTITLPLSILTANPDAIERLRLRPGERFFDDANCYWYPIEKTQPGCEWVAPGSLSSASALPVGNISVNNKSRHQLYTLLANLNKSQAIAEKIYEVSILFDEEHAKKETDTDNDEVIANSAKGSKEISLIYWPAQIGQQGIRPIIITGVYEDNSTGIYYLIVPLAFAGDVVVVTAALAATAILSCPNCVVAILTSND